LTLTGVQPISGYSLQRASSHIVRLLYPDFSLPEIPLSDRTPTKYERNFAIRERFAAGESIADLARDYDISDQRVFQIVHRRRK